MAMLRLKPIRRTKRGISRVALRAADGAFWLVFVFACILGADSVATGVPMLVRLFLPAFQAEAGVTPPVGAVRIPILQGETPQLRLRAEAGPDEAALPLRPVIAIVIDDLGADIAHTKRAIRLPSAVALAFLPYPAQTPVLARDAGRAGHEVLVHIPMQAEDAHDPGPMALAVDLPKDEILRRLDWAFARVPGFVGVNNHEGSRFTADAAALGPVMARVVQRHVFFFDSRTTPDSQVVAVARAWGVESSGRDVFLDDVATIDGVDLQLHALEAKARARGAAIAIGHPNEITLDAVAYWAAHENGFELVTLKEAVQAKTEHDLQVSAMR
jgi:polysaccharide deacetylase 2 family uncharacterized protein YibQ